MICRFTNSLGQGVRNKNQTYCLCQSALPQIEAGKSLGSKNERGSHMEDVEGSAGQSGRMILGK